MGERAYDRAANALFEDLHVNGHSLNDFESATAARIAVSAYLEALVEQLPEDAVEAAVEAALQEAHGDQDDRDLEYSGHVRATEAAAVKAVCAFLSALSSGGDGR